jgi:putative transcriptional regulator
MPEASDSERGPVRRIDALLAAYAAGTLSEPFAVLAASHLQMKADKPLAPTQPISALDDMHALMPLALRSYVGRHLAGAVEWRSILPGLKLCRIARDAQADASLLRCRPGKAIPAHTHAGLEAVLVLQGGFCDATGHYTTGDIAVADDTIAHRPIADGAADCIIFIVRQAPVRLTGRFGRFMQRFLERSTRKNWG